MCSNGAVTLGSTPAEPQGYEIARGGDVRPGAGAEPAARAPAGRGVAVEELGVGFRLSAPFPDGELQGELRVVPLEELIDSPATRVTSAARRTAEDFLELVERIGLHGVNYAVGWTAWLDLTPEGVSKGSALELVRRRLSASSRGTPWPSATGATTSRCCGWAARGVAMGNAPEEVKAVADEVAGDVEEDGLVAVLRSLVV